MSNFKKGHYLVTWASSVSKVKSCKKCIGIRNCLLVKIYLKTEAVLNSIGQGILQDCSGCLVKSSEQLASLQKCGTAQNRDINLTVISGQFRQQIWFKRRPKQTTQT